MNAPTKSILHDATPSWNGYNYQGKVGLYVCLENILNQLRKGTEAESFDLFLDEHHLEYEWIEDFAIKKNEKYISLHQVKHKGDNNFSNHDEAIATILYRKNCVLPVSDIYKYFDFSNFKEKHSDRIKKILRNRVISNHLVDENWTLNKNWNSNALSLNQKYRGDINNCFSDFESLSRKAFSTSITYFHTASEVIPPSKDICEMTNIPSHLALDLKNPRSLSCKDIHLSFDSQTKYDLALSDERLDQKLKGQIDEVLQYLHKGEQFSENDIKLYKTSLCSLVDQNLVKRHQHIRDKADSDVPYFQRIKPSISFKKFITELRKKYRDQDDCYWNLICRENFELAYKEKLIDLNSWLNSGKIDFDLYRQYQLNLELLRIDVFDQYLPDNCIDFLKKYTLTILRLD